MKKPLIMIALLSGVAGFAASASADDNSLNSLVTNAQLVALCAANVGSEAVPVELTIDNQPVTGTINCEQEYVDAAAAAVEAGQGDVASAGDGVEDGSSDEGADDILGDDNGIDDNGIDDNGIDDTDDSQDDSSDDGADDSSEDDSSEDDSSETELD